MTEHAESYNDLMERCGLAFIPPNDDFAFVAPVSNDQVKCHFSLALGESGMEIRYHLVSLKNLLSDLALDPNTSFDLNTLHDNHLASLIFNVSSEVIAPPNPLPKEAVQEEFGADRGSVCRLMLAPSAFSGNFQECFLLSLHRDDLADAYVFFMYQDWEKAQDAIFNNFYTLRFNA